ncbi:MbeB family mobilization protein (plasmid) [Escherichia coli]|nr:MbeB family mobilization protein [Escherichia coli]MDM4941577.1 MbeB family mobilization protein [Escherichia coli]
MSNLLQTGAEFEKKLKERAESTETMLNDEFSKLEKSVSKAVTSNETKIKDAIALFTASTEESLKKHREGVKEAMMQHRKDVLKLAGNTGMMLLGMVIFLFTVSGGTLWYLGGMDTGEPGRNQDSRTRNIAETEREDMGRGVCAGREQRTISGHPAGDEIGNEL